MSKYTLAESGFLYPSPAGAYHASSSIDSDRSQGLLRALFQCRETPLLTLENLQELIALEHDSSYLELLHHCEKVGLLQNVETAIGFPDSPLEKILPDLLKSISVNGKVLLADDQGFYLASSGFPHEVAEELSALSVEIANIHRRRSGVLVNNLGITSQAWSIVNATGNSQIGFWPLFIGNNRFLIVVSGVPHFNQPEFVSLIWALSVRYAKN